MGSSILAAGAKGRRGWRERQAIFAWLLIAPAAVYMLLVVAWPLGEAFRLSFTDSGLGGESYIGLENYERLAGSGKFHRTVGLTFKWMFLSVSLKVILGLIGASLLNANLRGKSMYRVMILPPWVVPLAIGCIGWLWLYQGHFGLIAGVLQRVGVLDGPFEFLAYRDSAFYSAVITDVWAGVPFVSLYFLAAMQAVPRDLYEAAYIDGASRWYRFRRITLPQIMPAIVSMSLLSAIFTFNSFEIIWILTEGGPRGATTTLIIDTYKTAVSTYKFGQGATRAVVIVVLLSAFSLLYLWFLNRINRRYEA